MTRPYTPMLGKAASSGLVMVLVALAVRLAALSSFQAYHIPSDQGHYAFGGEMGRIARSIVTGGGFGSPYDGRTGPSAIVGPVYPYLLAGVFKVFGTYTGASAWAILGLNSLFSALTCLPIRALARQTFGRDVGAVAGWTWVVFPYAIYWPLRWAWDTSLSALLFASVLLVAVRLAGSVRVRDWIAFGFLGALAVLVNTTMLAVVVIVIGWLAHQCHRRAERWARLAAAAFVAIALGLTPWLVRNYFAFGHFVLRSNLGLELYQGNYHQRTGLRDASLDPAYNKTEMAEYKAMGELPYMAEKQRQTLDFIRERPGTFAWLSFRRMIYFWTGTAEIVVPGRLLESLAFYTLVSVLAFTGLFLARGRATGYVALFATVLMIYPLPYYFTHPDSRFRHLMEPELVMLAAYAAASSVAVLWRTRRREDPQGRHFGDYEQAREVG